MYNIVIYTSMIRICLQCNNRFTALNDSKCICTVDEDSDGKPDLERTQVIQLYMFISYIYMYE